MELRESLVTTCPRPKSGVVVKGGQVILLDIWSSDGSPQLILEVRQLADNLFTVSDRRRQPQRIGGTIEEATRGLVALTPQKVMDIFRLTGITRGDCNPMLDGLDIDYRA